MDADAVSQKVMGVSVDAMLVMSRVAKGYSDEKIQRMLDIGPGKLGRCLLELYRAFELGGLEEEEQRKRLKKLYEVHRDVMNKSRPKGMPSFATVSDRVRNELTGNL